METRISQKTRGDLRLLSVHPSTWLCDPVPTRVLGQAIVKELAEKYEIVDFETEWDHEIDKLVKFKTKNV